MRAVVRNICRGRNSPLGFKHNNRILLYYNRKGELFYTNRCILTDGLGLYMAGAKRQDGKEATE